MNVLGFSHANDELFNFQQCWTLDVNSRKAGYSMEAISMKLCHLGLDVGTLD